MSDNKKGFLQVNNQIVDYWMAELTNAEFKTLLAIVRKTKGWNKPYDRISQSQIAELTGLTTRSVRTAVTLLEGRNLIIVAGDEKKTRLFSVNYHTVNNVDTDVTAIEKAIKDAEVISKDAEVTSHNAEVISKDAEVGFLHNKHYTKDTININTKDISSEVKKPKAPKQKTERELLVMDLFKKWKELSGQKIKPLAKRLSNINARLEDGFTVDEIIAAMTFVATDKWHVDNGHNTIELAIRSTDQLERKLIKANSSNQLTVNNQVNNYGQQPIRSAADEFGDMLEQQLAAEQGERHERTVN